MKLVSTFSLAAIMLAPSLAFADAPAASDHPSGGVTGSYPYPDWPAIKKMRAPTAENSSAVLGAEQKSAKVEELQKAGEQASQNGTSQTLVEKVEQAVEKVLGRADEKMDQAIEKAIGPSDSMKGQTIQGTETGNKTLAAAPQKQTADQQSAQTKAAETGGRSAAMQQTKTAQVGTSQSYPYPDWPAIKKTAPETMQK
ncbi:MAG TPA: hypothetical protein VEK34_02355 [Methylocella sp.]|nr:hypothetical protein [Methylocella sp.]